MIAVANVISPKMQDHGVIQDLVRVTPVGGHQVMTMKN